MAVPYGSVQALTTSPSQISVLDAKGNKATWIQIVNRSTSADTFQLSWDGVTYISQLAPGVPAEFGGPMRSPIALSSIWLQCLTSTATAEITCGTG